MKYSIFILAIISYSCDNSTSNPELADEVFLAEEFSPCYTNPNNRMLENVYSESGIRVLEENENFGIIINENVNINKKFGNGQLPESNLNRSTQVAFSKKVCNEDPIIINNKNSLVSFELYPLFYSYSEIDEDDFNKSHIIFGQNNEIIEWESADILKNMRFFPNDSTFLKGGKILWDNDLEARVIVRFSTFDLEEITYKNIEELRLDSLVKGKEIIFNEDYFDFELIDSISNGSKILEMDVWCYREKTEIQDFYGNKVAIISSSQASISTFFTY